MTKLREYLEEQLGTTERSRMDFEVSEISQMLNEIIKKVINTRHIGKAYFGKELKNVETSVRKTLKDVNNLIDRIRQE